MNTWLLPVLGVIALGALTYVCGNHHGPMIEADLTGKTTQALNAANLSGAKAAVDGQIITLTGKVASEADKQKAGDLAKSVYGVEEVHNLLEVKAAEKPPAAAETAAYAVPDRKAAIDCQEKFNNLLKDDIQFNTGSAVIHANSFKLLDQLASAAGLCPGAVVEVGGYTDNAGKSELNVKLSEKRANTVVAYLAKKGVDRGRLVAKGYGDANPIADNETAAGRSKNRRTEFKVKGL